MAQPAVKDDPAPGAASLLRADGATAEQEIRQAAVSKYDPARAINLGVALALKGDNDNAAKQFRRALTADEVQVTVANGRTESSHDVAAKALAALESGNFPR
ncbi:hypothetical protein G7077_07840 [Sphingomonas piscis]|uniref:Tetratricopeptide repeat protein n=1 Tax=Sphingomonas piscis TaxID=2714943 RepID=A0A6G7YQ02_9SPHN|nr:hypothetical protein [Sphingomonas piscis]QIK78820.1 hypothetical protein G7077_07840 [Sphingomonas piscis]